MNLVRADVPEMRLVLTGAGAEKLGQLPAWVEHRGRITRDELRDLYRRAACVAFLSLYEGFGLPPLEAMAVGCPVTVAASGALPEVCGDAAVFFDPNVPADAARGIREAMARSEDLAARGFRQVERFSWKSCAEAHVCAYREAALTG
jgi:glycosyltransferase involved in cell wall biosynthesis